MLAEGFGSRDIKLAKVGQVPPRRGLVGEEVETLDSSSQRHEARRVQRKTLAILEESPSEGLPAPFDLRSETVGMHPGRRQMDKGAHVLRISAQKTGIGLHVKDVVLAVDLRRGGVERSRC